MAQHRLHRDPEGLIEQVVFFAPGGEVLAAVHDAGQGAGDGEGRQSHLFVGHQAEHRGKGLRQAVYTALGQGDVQPGQAAAGLFARRVLPGAALGELPQLVVPVFRAVVVDGQGAQHAHPLHQGGGSEDLAVGQGPVILLHFPVVAHAGVKLGVSDEQLRHLGVVPAFGVAF